MYEEYLMHYGRLGMKWGQHIFGRDRSSSSRKKSSENAKNANKMASRKKKILSSPRLLYRHRNEFTKQEIDEAIKKIQWERQLKQLSDSQVSKGERFIDGYVKWTAKTSKVINTTKALNKATGGVLFGAVDKKLRTNPTYANIKKQIDEILKEVNPPDKDKKDKKDKSKKDN